MKFKYIITLLLHQFILMNLQAVAQGNINLVPAPFQIVKRTGHFSLTNSLKIHSASKFTNEGAFLATQLKSSLSSIGSSGGIKLIYDKRIIKDAYKLEISQKEVGIIASSHTGITTGLFSLLQLQLLQNDKNSLPCLAIYDKPRFAYRGLHLDASRNFIPLPEVKKIIDMMAIYKLNTFHWHLTDGPGWRIEIKKYPELTSFAAWRPFKDWKSWWASERHYISQGAPGAYGGYYSQDDARELVSYAAKRGISVIPEIEMPGHSEEVLAAYPFLACSGKPYTQSEFCIGNERVFEFIENVLSEIIKIFPGTYIHMGGDEADSKAWLACPICQARMKSEHLATGKELQAYAMKRIEKFLSINKRKLVGWDEIVDGGLPKKATVMSWRGEEGGIEAARQGHEVIMTPGSFCYFDQYQTDPSKGPEAIGGYLPIEKVYAYEPISELLEQKNRRNILGTQANVWTEYINDENQLEYMIFPRILALAEVSWSAKQKKNWTGFFQRLQSQYLLLQRKNINYYRPSQQTTISSYIDTIKGVNNVLISSEKYKPEIRYSTDGSGVNKQSTLYTGPFQVKGITTIRSAVLESGKVIGGETVYETIFHKGVGAKVSYLSPYSQKYPAQGNLSLVNGQLGGFSYNDGQWQGFEGKKLEILITLKQVEKVDSLAIHFMQLIGPGIFMPSKIEYSWSENGKEFSETREMKVDISVHDPKMITKFFVGAINSKARYLKIVAVNNMRGFLFADEIVIY